MVDQRGVQILQILHYVRRMGPACLSKRGVRLIRSARSPAEIMLSHSWFLIACLGAKEMTYRTRVSLGFDWDMSPLERDVGKLKRCKRQGLGAYRDVQTTTFRPSPVFGSRHSVNREDFRDYHITAFNSTWRSTCGGRSSWWPLLQWSVAIVAPLLFGIRSIQMTKILLGTMLKIQLGKVGMTQMLKINLLSSFQPVNSQLMAFSPWRSHRP